MSVLENGLDSLPTAVSLFSGAGGMDIGVADAGFEILAAIENDPHCCRTLNSAVERGHIRAKILESDIRRIDPEQLMDEFHLQPGELNLLYGGPPCQAFSQIGKRKGLEDERGLLLFQVVRFAAVFQPKALLIEQVKGLLTAKDIQGNKGGIFEMLLSELEDLGYSVSWKLINAADYGLPQTRRRVFIVALKNGKNFVFPAATHAPPHKITPLLPLETYVTVGEAIGDLGLPSAKGEEREDSHIDVTPDRDRERIKYVPEGSWLAAQTHLSKEFRRNLTRKDTTKFRRLSRNEPSLTLRGGEAFYHPTQDRYLTPRECMRIHGFPDSYVLKGPIRGRSGSVRNLDQHRQVANAVPPPLAELLATQILKALQVHVEDF